MYEVLDKETMKSEILLHLPAAKRGYASKSNLLKAFQCILYKLKTSLQWHLMRKKSRLLLYVSYVLMSEWMCLCQNTIRRTLNSFTCPLVNPSAFVSFSVRDLTLRVAFLSTNCAPCRKKSILAKVCFDAEKGWHAHAAEWIFIRKHSHLHLFRGYLPLNRLRFAAK